MAPEGRLIGMDRKWDMPALFTAVGMLVYQASSAEVTLQIAHRAIHGRAVPNFWRKPWSVLIRDCRRELERNATISHQRKPGIATALDRLETTLLARNRIIHDVWTWGEHGQPAQIIRDIDGNWGERSVSVEMVRTTAKDLDSASVDLFSRVIAAVPRADIKPILTALAIARGESAAENER